MKAKSLAFCALLVLAGCTSSNNHINIREDFALSEDSGSGVVVASVTYSGSFSGYSVYFREVADHATTGKLQIGSGMTMVPPGMMEWDIERPGLRGNVFTIELPAGEYEVFKYSASSGYAHGSTRNPISIKFDVVPGEVTYLGNFLFKRTAGFGATVLGLDILHSNKASRDLEIAGAKHPYLDVTEPDLILSGAGEN